MSTSATSGTALIQGTSYTSGAGIDVTSTVNAIITSKQTPETAWKNDQKAITSQEAALATLQTEVASIESSFQSLNDFSGVFSGLTTSSTNSSVVSATTTTGAAAGTHKITVTSLATTGVSYSNALATASTTFTAGSLVFSVGSGAQQTINIPGTTTTDASGTTTTSTTTTLTAAAAYINQQGAGITASVVTDSTGSRLALSSNASGSTGSVNVQSAPGGLSFTNVAGTDAQLTVDGVPLTSSTNKVSTAIPGVTLDLTGTSASEVGVDVAPDKTKITAAVNSFITAYNAAITDLNNQFQSNGTSASSSAGSTGTGVLETDSAARITQQQLLSSVSVVTSSNATFKTLGSLGITMGNDGTLSLNSTTLASALDNNLSDVQSYFQSTDTTSFASTFANMMSAMTDVTNSPIVLDVSSLKDNYTADQKNIDNLEATLATLRATLISQYSTLDALLKTFPTTLNQINTELGYRTTTSSS